MNLPDPDPDVYEAKWKAAQHHTHVTFIKDRTLRACVFFYGSLAQKHGVRLSALVAHLVGWLRAKRKTDPNAYEYDPCKKFAAALGIGTKQVCRLLKRAKAAGLIDYAKSLNQTKIWVIKDSLFDLGSDDRFEYDRDLAKKLGLNASILYTKLAYHTLYPDHPGAPGYRANLYRFVKKFPWMTEQGVRFDLQQLIKTGYVTWHNENCHFTSHCYLALRLKKPKEGEGVIDTVRRSLSFIPDQAHLERQVKRGRAERGRKTCSPQSVTSSERRCYSRAAAPDAAGPETM